jgi:hypothetical protein
LRPYLLSSLGAWLYFVRPNGAVVVLAIAIYLFRIDRRMFAKYLVSGGVWLAVFFIYSYTQFRQLVPSYYKPSRLRLDLFPVAFAGNLVSPSRGVLIYVPLTAFVLYLLISYRQTLPSRKLALLSSIIILGHLILVSSFANQWGDWWGGASYGPRYLSDVVPWFAVLMMLGLGAFLASYKKENHAFLLRRKVELTAGAALLTLSILINARGALAVETWRWTQPVTDTQMRSLLWDWKHPQFMAGLQRPKPPVEVAPIPMGRRIHFGSWEVEKFLWYGWSDAEPGFRWTDGREAALVFSADKMSDLRFRIRAGAFVTGEQLVNQNVRILLNDTEIRTLQLQGFSIEIEVSPVTVQPGLNSLRIELPNATSPGSLGRSQDNRLLGIRVEWIEFLETRRT